MDGGALRQQLELERERLNAAVSRPAPPASVALPPAKKFKTIGAGVKVRVNRWRLEGNSFLPEAEVQRELQRFSGRELSFQEIDEAVDELERLFQRRGVLVRVDLPLQDVQVGEIRLQLTPLTLAQWEVQQSGKRFDEPRLLAVMQALQAQGEPVLLRQLDAGLTLLNERPGVKATAALRRNTEDAKADVVLTLEDTPRLSGRVGVDNAGPRATGELRGVALLRLSSLAGFGDRVDVQAVGSEGLQYAAVQASVPVTAQGARVGVRGSALKYNTVVANAGVLGDSGRSDSVGLDLEWPFYRDALNRWVVQPQLEKRWFLNNTSGQAASRYTSDAAWVHLKGRLAAPAGGNAFTSASVGLGLVNTRQTDANGTAPEGLGRAAVLRFSLAHEAELAPRWKVQLRYTGQRATRSLNPSEQLFAGGAGGVRAYPALEGLNASGVVLSADLRYQLTPQWSAGPFLDAAAMNDPSREGKRNYLGAGLGSAWALPAGISLRAEWARRLGDNPDPQPLTGRDRDGSLSTHRFGASAVVDF